MPATVIKRKPVSIDWKIFVDLLAQTNIITDNFTGDIHLTLNRGGVTACKKIETVK